MNFEQLDEFKRDLKRLQKRYRTIADDIDIVKKVLEVNPQQRPPFSYQVTGLGIETCIIKVKKIASRSLKGKGVNSGFRLVYAFFEKPKKIVFIEIYFKGEKENEDRERITSHFH